MIRFLLFLLTLLLAGYSSTVQAQYCQVYTGESAFTNSTFHGTVIVNPQGPININATMAAPEEEMKLIKEFIQLQISLSNDPLLEQMSFEDQLKYINRKTKTYKTERLKLEAAREGITLERKNAKKAQEQLLSNMKKQNDEIQTLVEENAQKIKNPSLVKELKASAQKAETIYTSTQACVSNDYEVIPIKDTKTGEIVYGFSLEEIRQDPNYVLIDDYQEGLARVKRNNKFGFYDDAGELVIPFKYDYAESFSGGLALVQNLGEWFLIDKNEERLYTLHEKDSYREGQYTTVAEHIYHDRKGLDYVDNYVRIDNGKMVRFRELKAFNDQGFALIKQNYLWGFINDQGQVILPPIYNSIEKDAVFKGYYLVQNKNNRYGILDTTFQEIIPFEFKYIKAFENPYQLDYYHCTNRDKKKGLYKLNGEEVFPPIYDDLKILSGYMLAKKENKYGLFSTKGHKFIACEYGKIAPDRKQNIIEIIQNGKIGFTDRHGKILVEPAYEELEDFDSKGIARIKDTNGQWGLINLKGELISPCQFHSIRKEFYPGFYEVRQDTLYGLIDDQGNTLFSTEYKKLDYIYFKSSRESVEPSRSYREENTDKYKVYRAKVSDIIEVFVCSRSFKEEGDKYEKHDLWRFNRSTRKFTHAGEELLYSSHVNELSYWGDNIIQIHNKSIGIMRNAYIFDTTFKLMHNLGDDEIVGFDKHSHLLIKKGTGYSSTVYLADKTFQPLSDDYKRIEICKNGMYLARSYRYGYLNNEGQLVIATKYQEALPFEEDNRAIVKQEEKWGIIDQYGAEIIVPAFERIERTSSGFRVHFNEKKVFDVDRNGKCTSRKAEQYNDLVKAFHNK